MIRLKLTKILLGSFVISSLMLSEPVFTYADDTEITEDEIIKEDVSDKPLNGVIKVDDNNWYYYVDGEIQTGKETIKHNEYGWWYIGTDGKVDFSMNTVAKNEYGWWVVRDGKVRFDYNGIAGNSYGDWYCHCGKVDFSANGVLKASQGWYYFQEGKVQKENQTIEKNNYGWWYIGTDGKVDFSKYTVAKNRYGWWVIQGGKVNFGYNGVASNQYGQWYCTNGKVNFNANGMLKAGNSWYSFSGGKVQNDNDWVSGLNIAKSVNQLVIVGADGTYADVSMHFKDGNGRWHQLVSTSGRVGKNGLGKTREGDKKTPIGLYAFTKAFGNAANPGCALPYTQCDSSFYWVDDGNSRYYNQFVSTHYVKKDWKSAEHISGVGASYNYVLALNYNASNVRGAGSAIFLHCGTKSTAGCIAVPENSMREIMKNVHSDCYILIDSKSNINKY